MKFRLILISLVAAGALTSTQAAAESIAIFNFQQILHDSLAGKSAKDQLDAKQKSFQAEMSKKEEELNKEQDKLFQQKAVLSQEAFEKKAKDFRTRMNAAQRDVQEKKGELDNALFSASNEIQKNVGEIVHKLAQEKGYTLVMPATPLMYYDPKLDITNDVLARLNASMPKITLNFKNPLDTGKGDE